MGVWGLAPINNKAVRRTPPASTSGRYSHKQQPLKQSQQGNAYNATPQRAKKAKLIKEPATQKAKLNRPALAGEGRRQLSKRAAANGRVFFKKTQK